MDEQTLEKNDVLQELLKSEYDLAKHECEYYTQEFNKQDTVYEVHKEWQFEAAYYIRGTYETV